MTNLTTEIPLAGAVSAGLLGVCCLLFRRRGAADYAFAAGVAVLAAEGILDWLAIRPYALAAEQVRWLRASVGIQALLPFPWLVFSLSYARGNARQFLSKWRILLALALLAPVALVYAGREGLILATVPAAGGPWAISLGPPALVLEGLELVASVILLMNLERTFRASTGTMRWRVKFMVTGTGLLFVIRIYTVAQELIFHRYDPALNNFNAVALVVALIPILRSFFRSGPRDLEVYPSHRVLQGSLTLVLAGSYLVVVGLLAKGLRYIGGGNIAALQTLLALAALVLFVVLLQSDRIRMGLSRFVSRNFARPEYDYRTVWRMFTEGNAAQMDQTEQCRSLVKLVSDVFQTLSVAAWSVENETMLLAASTFLSAAEGHELAPRKEDVAVLVSHFLAHPQATDADASTGPWTGIVKRMHPSEFPKKESRVCFPMIGQGRLVGLLILGDRVGTSSFTEQDFDMLSCVGDHATASLLNVQLSQKLLQARELEAFQTMAAFFVHDLKNAASTLSLMLKNLPVHFEDPSFRQDALRGLGKSVDHINHIISRLGLLRKGMISRPAELDLNEMAVQAVAGLESPPDFVVSRELSPLPRVWLDREQIAKVVTNLVLNAKEALDGKGKVELATRREADWAVISVRDAGCGMTPEFMENSLYRPFQSTKKNGLGIGMFQSKMIVEVNGGRLAVESEPGQGTTFQVFLPLNSKAG